MVVYSLQVSKHTHQQSGVVLVVRDAFDQSLQRSALFFNRALLKLGGEVGGLWWLNHRVVVDDKVAVARGFVH